MRRITSSYYNYYYKNKIKLIMKIISKFRYINPEELESIARSELLYSMIYFNQSLGSFNTYLYIRIRGNILRYIRDEKEWCRNDDIDPNLLFGEKDHCSRNIFVNEILSSLNPREKQILELYYLENNTLREISEKLCISTNCVFVTKNKALNRIKDTFSCL